MSCKSTTYSHSTISLRIRRLPQFSSSNSLTRLLSASSLAQLQSDDLNVAIAVEHAVREQLLHNNTETAERDSGDECQQDENCRQHEACNHHRTNIVARPKECWLIPRHVRVIVHRSGQRPRITRRTGIDGNGDNGS